MISIYRFLICNTQEPELAQTNPSKHHHPHKIRNNYNLPWTNMTDSDKINRCLPITFNKNVCVGGY